MAEQFKVNAVVDIYRGFLAANPYPLVGATPDVAQVRGYLKHHVRHGRFGYDQHLHWTSVLYLPPNTDVRGAYDTQINAWDSTNADTVVLPDFPIKGWCTAFLVVLVQPIRTGNLQGYLRVYLDRLQPREGACFRTGCCATPIPGTLSATIPGPSGCPCLDDVVVTLTYSPATQKWEGDQNVCDDENLHIEFQCNGTSCEDATLTVSLENHGSVGPVAVDSDCSCDPLQMTFSDMEFPELGSECDGAISVVFTE